MAQETVRVRGLREFQKAVAKGDKETRKKVRERYRKVGDIVKVEASDRFAGIDGRSASGFRTSVRQRGVSVEQSIRKTTGLRPDFGSLQMRKALLPALADKEDDVVHEFEDAIDDVADIIENG